MRKFLLILLFIPLVALGQTTIPKPSEVGVAGYVKRTEIIGDFDGDLSNDMSVWWHDSLSGIYTHFSVYSFKKNTHLLVIEGDGYPTYNGYSTKIKYVGDLDGDNTVEIVIDDKVYSFTNTGIKKKHQ